MGDERRFELNGDGYYDLYIKLESIERNKVNILIKKISELITNETELEEAAKNEVADENLNKELVKTLRNRTYFILTLVVILIIFFIVLFIILKIKKRSIKENI